MKSNLFANSESAAEYYSTETLIIFYQNKNYNLLHLNLQPFSTHLSKSSLHYLNNLQNKFRQTDSSSLIP